MMQQRILTLLSPRLFTIAFVALLPAGTYASQQDLQFSGFGRLVAGVAQHGNSTAQVYDNKLTIKPNSLIAIQADWQVASTWSVTSQAIAYLNDDKNSGIEWLYLSYQPQASTRIKLGRLRTPFFSYSDVLDVGYAYHWLTPPSEVYAPYFFSNFDGASIIHSFDSELLTTSIEAYLGRFKGAVTKDGQTNDIDINYLGGLSIKSTFDNLTLRAAINIGSIAKSTPRSQQTFAQLQQLFERQQRGYLIEDVDFKGTLSFSQLGFSYDTFDYFVKGEWTHLEHQFTLIPTTTSFYLSAGYQLDNVLLHLTYADRNDSIDQMPNLVGTELPTLRDIYQQLIDSRISSDLHSVTVGIRWDCAADVALKLDLSRINYLDTLPEPLADDSILSVGIEWVF